MSTTRRLLIAIPLALVFLGAVYFIYIFGFSLGGMATDSCDDLRYNASIYLQYLWPAVMGIAALIPSALIIAKVRWRWVWVALIGGLIISTGCYCAWFFPILSLVCK